MKIIFLFVFFVTQTLVSNAQVDPELLYKSFRQGERTNCASIALIKASLEVYGLDSLFILGDKNADGISVILKDGTSEKLSKTELELSRKSAGFVLMDSSKESIQIYEYAILTYAILAKHKMTIENYNKFEDALTELEYGANASEVYKYLGFRKNKEVVKHKRFTGGNLCGLIAWSPAHAVYSCNGIMDYHGQKRNLWAKYSGRLQIIK